MAPALFLALALFAADTDAIATGAPATALIPSQPAQGEPASEYELVGWCYGALGAHMGLYEVAMPEVERIERQFAEDPAAADEDIAGYAAQREEGQRQLALFRRAMEAAEKASIQPLQETGVAAIRKGEAVWTGVKMADPKFLAREWMSWGLPERCATTAEALEAKSALLGQAISYNTTQDKTPVNATETVPLSEAAPEAAPEPVEEEAETVAPEDEAAVDEQPDALDAIITEQVETDDGP